MPEEKELSPQEQQEDLAPLIDTVQLSTQRAIDSYQESTSTQEGERGKGSPREIKTVGVHVRSNSGTILTVTMDERGIKVHDTPIGDKKGKPKRDRFFLGARAEVVTLDHLTRTSALTRTAKLPEDFEVTTRIDALLQEVIPPTQDAGEKIQQKRDEENYEYFEPYFAPPAEHRLFLDKDIQPDIRFMRDILVIARDTVDRGLSAKATKRDISLFALKEHFMWADSRGSKAVVVLPRMGLGIFVKTKQGSEAFAAIRGAMGTRPEVLLRYEEDPNPQDKDTTKKRVEKLAKQVIDEANALDRAQTAVAGEFAIILSPQAAGVFAHEVFGHTAEGDIICENRRSKTAQVQLKSRIGSQVSSNPKFSIIDTGEDTIDFGGGRVLRFSWGSVPVDHYGEKTKRAQIVENGIMVGALLNHLTFNEVTAGVQDNVRQRMLECGLTGSSRSEKHDSESPLIRMRGTYIQPDSDGPRSVEDMARLIPSTQKGLYMKSCMGGQVNTETGEFEIRGGLCYLIESGHITEKPVKNVTIRGNIQKIGELVRALGSSETMHHDFTGFCGKDGQWVPVSGGGPLVLLEKVQLGGGVYAPPWSELVHEFHLQHEEVLRGIRRPESIDLSRLTSDPRPNHQHISMLTAFLPMADELSVLTGQYPTSPGDEAKSRDFSTHEFDEITGEIRPRGERHV